MGQTKGPPFTAQPSYVFDELQIRRHRIYLTDVYSCANAATDIDRPT